MNKTLVVNEKAIASNNGFRSNGFRFIEEVRENWFLHGVLDV